jgi:hypothetical protein
MLLKIQQKLPDFTSIHSAIAKVNIWRSRAARGRDPEFCPP